jgi:hypothetical protein
MAHFLVKTQSRFHHDLASSSSIFTSVIRITMGDEFTAEYFDARIAELKEQIVGKLPTLESSEPFAKHDELCTAVWTAWEEFQAAREAKDKATNNEEKNELKQIENQKRDAFVNTRATNRPLQMDEADAFQAEIDDTLKEIENEIMECVILIRSEPARLAEWCAEKESNPAMWKEFMENKELQKKMIVNGGAALGKYYKSLELHVDVTKNLDNDAPNEVFDKIALAVALELAEPVEIFKKPGEFVDPVERFWHYANAHTYNQLDKHFAGLTVWELRNVVNSNATNEDSTWLREFLKRYRPDQVRTPCSKWKYIWSQRTDTASRPVAHEFENFPDLVSAGGPCGPQAWYSRALIRAWGLPAWGVKQPGHAAISRWYPEGCWGTELGMAWKSSTFLEMRYYKEKHGREGLDFDEDGRGRFNASEEDYFYGVALLESIADIQEEWLVALTPSTQIWRSMAISRRFRFANSPWRDEPKEWKNKPRKHRRPLLPETPETFSTDEKMFFKRGVWVIPPATCTSPDLPTEIEQQGGVYHEFKDTEFPYYPSPDYRSKHVHVMMSWDGQWCITVGRVSRTLNWWVEYTMPDDFPAGSYELNMKYVTVHREQYPMKIVTIDPEGTESEETLVEIAYTRGEWGKTEPITVEMKPGSKFKFGLAPGRKFSVTIKEFYLKPADA